MGRRKRTKKLVISEKHVINQLDESGKNSKTYIIFYEQFI